MTRPLPKHVSGERVRLALMAARPGGLPKRDLLAVTELTNSQISAGLIWIREVAASEHLTPLTYSRRDGYQFSDEPADWVDYERSQLLRTLTTIVRTVKGTLDPHLQRVPQDRFADMAVTHAEAMVKTLDFITRQPYPPRPPAPANAA